MRITKILFIRSSLYADDGRLVTARTLSDRITAKNLAELSIPLLAAYTPKHIDVEMVDDCLEVTPENTTAEVVAITAWIIHAERAIDLAKHFKKLGKVVVMGGYLASMHPEQVESYVDSVCVGEGDEIWPQMLRDIENDCLKKRYVSSFTMSLDKLPVPRYDIIRNNKLIPLLGVSYPVQATRGCPFHCDYCSITSFYHNTYRLRPVNDIIRDIKAHGSKYMHFVDDNLMENKKFAKELFSAMKGLKVIWGTQTTANMANDPELLDLAYQAGCRILMIGFESISQESLNDVSKRWMKANHIKETISKIQKSGILVHALIMFGLPNDTKEVFEESVKVLENAGAAAAEFFIFTPYPKTVVGKKYLEENRIIDHNLSHYREPYVVFKHDNLTSKQIHDGYWRAFEKFYSLRSIFKRMVTSNCRNKIMQVFFNLYYWLKIKRKIVPTHFQRGNYSYFSFSAKDKAEL